ncbi:MAG: hypothetical protein QXM37_06070 [Candidatus Bathyarchaeia archaeon]
MRVLSYLNWPHGHGVGLDEIFERVEDVDKAYMGSAKDLMEVVKKYGVKYVYVGFEELKNYPNCALKFDKIEWLKLVYDGSFKVYKVALNN